MEVKERRPYRSLTARRDAERRYTSSSADSEDGKANANAKSYSSSETLKAFDQDSRMAAYGTRVKDLVHHEVDEFNRQETQCVEIQGKETQGVERETQEVETQVETQEVERETQEVETQVETQEVERETQEVETQVETQEVETQEVERETQEVETQEVERETQEVEPETQEVERETQEVEPETQEVETETQEVETQEVERETQEVVTQEVVTQEACRPRGADFSLRDLGFGEALPSHVPAVGYRGELGLQQRDYSASVGSDADTETDGVMSPEHAARLWGRGGAGGNPKSGRSSCLSSRANSNLTLTDTEHENTESGRTAPPYYTSAPPPPNPPHPACCSLPHPRRTMAPLVDASHADLCWTK
ncbi:unnamed protein product [Arctogadus glacialis]